jgi:hypothetical protein
MNLKGQSAPSKAAGHSLLLSARGDPPKKIICNPTVDLRISAFRFTQYLRHLGEMNWTLITQIAGANFR